MIVASAAGALVPYEPGRVSVPADQRTACPLSDLLDDDTSERIVDFEHFLLLGPNELASVYDQTDSCDCMLLLLATSYYYFWLLLATTGYYYCYYY